MKLVRFASLRISAFAYSSWLETFFYQRLPQQSIHCRWSHFRPRPSLSIHIFDYSENTKRVQAVTSKKKSSSPSDPRVPLVSRPSVPWPRPAWPGLSYYILSNWKTMFTSAAVFVQRPLFLLLLVLSSTPPPAWFCTLQTLSAHSLKAN